MWDPSGHGLLSWAKKHKAAIAGFVTNVVVTGGCLIATQGAAAPLCLAVGGAAGGAVQNLVDKQADHSLEGYSTAANRGAVFNLVGGAVGKGVGLACKVAKPCAAAAGAIGSKAKDVAGAAGSKVKGLVTKTKPAAAAAEDATEAAAGSARSAVATRATKASHVGADTRPLAVESTPPTSSVGAASVAKEGADDSAPFVGQTVYRVFGGTSPMSGASWSPVDPRSVANYRDLAGLPSDAAQGLINTGRFLVQGVVEDLGAIVKVRGAEPMHGNMGGIAEYVVPGWLESGAISLKSLSYMNPEF